MHLKDLENLIIKRHKYNKADELLVLSGYIGPVPIEKISKEDINVTVILGILKSLQETYHKKYVELSERYKNLKIYYKKHYNHSKIYCWLKDKKIVEIISGSANFSVSGLLNDYQEVLYNIKNEDHENTENYIQDAIEDSVLCKEHKFISTEKNKLAIKNLYLDQIISRSPPAARLSLRDSKGGLKGGINIGQEKLKGHHVHINDCYVPLRPAIIEELPELFPNQGVNVMVGTGWTRNKKKPKSNAEFLFDDGEVMAITFEQKGKQIDNYHIYKGFRSFKPNKLLGEYLRKRMNIKSGKPFTESDFKKYGRDTIDLTLLGEGQYFADFSVKNKSS